MDAKPALAPATGEQHGHLEIGGLLLVQLVVVFDLDLHRLVAVQRAHLNVRRVLHEEIAKEAGRPNSWKIY